MSLIRVMPKNILVDLKRKKSESVSNIKHVYNVRYQNNMAIRGTRIKIQQLLKLLDDNHYISRYKVCEEKSLFVTHSGLILKVSSCSTHFTLFS